MCLRYTSNVPKVEAEKARHDGTVEALVVKRCCCFCCCPIKNIVTSSGGSERGRKGLAPCPPFESQTLVLARTVLGGGCGGGDDVSGGRKHKRLKDRSRQNLPFASFTYFVILCQTDF